MDLEKVNTAGQFMDLADWEIRERIQDYLNEWEKCIYQMRVRHDWLPFWLMGCLLIVASFMVSSLPILLLVIVGIGLILISVVIGGRQLLQTVPLNRRCNYLHNEILLMATELERRRS